MPFYKVRDGERIRLISAASPQGALRYHLDTIEKSIEVTKATPQDMHQLASKGVAMEGKDILPHSIAEENLRNQAGESA